MIRAGMIRTRTQFLLMAAVLMALLAGYGAQRANAAIRAARQDSASPAQATLADLAWLAGRWAGTVGTNQVEQICSGPEHGMMMGMFRVIAGDKIAGIELYTIEPAANGGIEEHVRFFTPALEPDDPPVVTLVLKSLSPNQVVFENPSGNYPKRSTLTRNSADAFHSHIELMDAKGKSMFIDADWKRVQ
jgi:hypothetical protein